MGRASSPKQRLGPTLLLAVVTALTLATNGNHELSTSLSASADTVTHGQVWRLLTSGLFAERPLAASVVSFALLAGLTLAVCGSGIFWASAIVGQVASALAVYVSIGLWRAADARDLRHAWIAPDYGASAISAAWLGSLAAAGWRSRGSSWVGRAAIGLCCVAIATFAYMLRPGITPFSSEHVIAFAIGAVIAARCVKPGVASPVRAPRLRRVDPIAAAAALGTLFLMVGAMIPTALGAFGRNFLDMRDRRAACLRTSGVARTARPASRRACTRPTAPGRRGTP